MKAIIRPSKAEGRVAAPPSKSMAHRMLICAGLAKGESCVEGIASSQDVLATLDCLEALGASYKYDGECVKIYGIDLSGKFEEMTLNCRECGSTLRFFIPIALLTGARTKLCGSETLMKRPLSVYEEICQQDGFLYEKKENTLTVLGKLKARNYAVKGNISSQFISGLLFALPLLKEDSKITLIPPVESRSYINMTISALEKFDVKVLWQDENTLVIPGGQTYRAKEVQVEGDYSNAAFFEALNLAGGRVEVTGLSEESLQGDKVYKELFSKLKESQEIINIENCPDLGPVLFAAAALCGGGRFTGTRRLKIKESDRGEAMKEELKKFGISVEIEENSITVLPGSLKTPDQELNGHNDHRIVMALSVLASLTGGTINEAEAVRKSFPDFFQKLKDLNIEVTGDGMDQ